MSLLTGVDFQGVGYLGAEKKPKKEPPKVAPPLPSPKAKSKSAFPRWLPAAVGAAGLAIVIGLLVTAKGKN